MSNSKTSPNVVVGFLDTANGNLDGTGTIVDLVTGASNGTPIKRVLIKSQGITTQGMIRFFINDGTNYFLIQEVPVPATQPGAVVPTFGVDVSMPIFLKSGYVLSASTEQGEPFTVAAFGSDITECSCPS